MLRNERSGHFGSEAAPRLRATALAIAALTTSVCAMAQEGGGAPDSTKATPAFAGNVQDVVVSTGNRGDQRTVGDSVAPVDVVTGEQIEKLGGNTTLRDALSQLIPSWQTQTQASYSADSVARPAGLRGLSGSHVLVLVNGKRRHNSSLINLATGNLDNGSNPVDLDLIPISAIDHIEILRDGAAAQYGSDAIAGVVNIILRKSDHGITSNTTGGSHYHYGNQDNGATVQETLNWGFHLPNHGFIDFALDAKSQDSTVRNAPATGAFYYPVNGQPDPREKTVNKSVFQGGLPKIKSVNLSYNAELPINDRISLYSFTTVSRRDAWVGQNFRRPNSTNIIPQLYPDGTAPTYTLNELDYQALVGAKGKMAGWQWDLSTTYGRDHVTNGSENSLNASLGPGSPTSFETYAQSFSQWTTNLDLTRAFQIGLNEPLAVSWGFEHRHEQYRTVSGDPLSYENGGYVFPTGPLAGQRAAVGAQGAVTVTPGDQANISRNNYATYIDFSLSPIKRLFIDLAGRLEHYDDSSGNTASGKVAARYEFSSAFALRGTISNGFRAPSLPQEGFAQTSNQYNIVNGVQQFVTSKSVQVSSPIGQALGATPLKPEKSTNYSVGLTFTPTHDLNVTVDAYEIILKNRIAQTGFLSGAGVNQILVANGFAPNESVQYFANAIDTRTKGIDVVADYLQNLHSFGAVRWTLGFNWNLTKITHINDNPAQLSGLGLTLFDRAAQGAVTVANPKNKLILGAEWLWGPWDVNLRETRYGSTTLLNDNPAYDQHYGARWLTDIDVAYSFNKHTTLAVGANNLFNVYPDRNTIANPNGFSPYSSISPFGFYGGFYYARLTVTY